MVLKKPTQSVNDEPETAYDYLLPVSAGYKVTIGDIVTIGEALEAAALTAGDKPVRPTDAAAILAAEVRAAAGLNVTIPGGVAAAAQSAATFNLLISHNDYRTKLADDAKMKLLVDKVATQGDAEAVKQAELWNNAQ